MKLRVRGAGMALFALILAIGLFGPTRTAHGQSPSKDTEAANKKGDEFYHQNKFKEAVEAYKAALAGDPDNDHAMEFIALSYSKTGDRASARDWMQKRVDKPGQSPSIKARVLTDIALLYWDEADMRSAAQRAGLTAAGSAGDIDKLIGSGTDSAQKAVAIAPRSVRAFNLLNLLNREAALLEPDPSKQKEYIEKADAALRQCIQFFDAMPQVVQSDGMFATPMVVAGAAGATKLGPAKTTVADEFRNAKGDSVTVEVFVGADGKVAFPRLIAGKGKLAEDLLAACRKWQFEPATFDGHAVAVVQSVTFPSK
ncbi:MAG: tetratricopeptide repeat protein [Blastocatellia bacterium]